MGKNTDNSCDGYNIEGDRVCNFADKAAKKAVEDTFAILGVDVHNPAAVEEFRISLRFGDKMRKASDRGLLTLVVVLTGMGAAALFAGFGIKIKPGGP